MTKTITTDPIPSEMTISAEMRDRIEAGRLDYRKGKGWHDPRGHDPELERRCDLARSYTRGIRS